MHEDIAERLERHSRDDHGGRGLLHDAAEEIKRLRRYRICHEALLVAYRTGKRPREKVLDELAQLRNAEAAEAARDDPIH